jgi:hypothetical protein
MPIAVPSEQRATSNEQPARQFLPGESAVETELVASAKAGVYWRIFGPLIRT